MKKILLVAALASLCTLSGPSRAATEEATLTFVAPDGVRLEGVVVYPGAESDWAAPYPLAILVHHHGRNRDSLIPLADALALTRPGLRPRAPEVRTDAGVRPWGERERERSVGGRGRVRPTGTQHGACPPYVGASRPLAQRGASLEARGLPDAGRSMGR